MKTVIVAGAAVNQLPLDWEGNLRRIVRGLEEARAQRAQIVCFPELCLSGYGCEDAFTLDWIRQRAVVALVKLLPQTEGMIVALGLPWPHEGKLYNACAVVVDGRIEGIVCKSRLYEDSLRPEARWFCSWPWGKRTHVAVDGRLVPFGDVVFQWDALSVGVRIGEDLWTDGGELADIVLNPVADPFGLGRFALRRRMVARLAAVRGFVCVSANLLGNEAGRVIYDGSVLVVTSDGEVTFGPRLSFRPVSILAVPVTFGKSAGSQRGQVSSSTQVNSAEYVNIRLTSQGDVAKPERFPAAPRPADWENSPHVKEEEFTRAIALGLFDYMRKAKARGFVVSISGGADSSAISCLIAIGIHLAFKELGREGFLEALSYFPELAEENSAEGMVRRLLRLVYQPSCNSSEASRESAEAVARALGTPFAVVPIDPIVQLYVQAAERVLGRPLRWESDDVALQNIQSRVRSPLAWLLANAEGKLFVATGNRSEAVVGYATMDGDTCGGLAPLGCVSKAFLRKWLGWLERVGPEGFGPIPALSFVNKLAPSAELRPPEQGQTDEGELMPYEVLEAIEEAILRDGLSPEELSVRIGPRFPRFSREQIAAWVDKFLKLWSASQWKRERFAPAFFVGEEFAEAWMLKRLPILSAGLSTKNSCGQS